MTSRYLQSMSIAKKLTLLTISAIIGIVILTTLFLLSERQLILEERQANVRQAVETAYGILDHYHAIANKGVMPQQEAQQKALETIRGLRYGGTEYFWVMDTHPTMLMHPIKPNLDHKDLTDNQDPDGKRLFVEMTNTVKAGKAGFVFYMWPKPGSDKPVQKVSYVKGFAPWGWIIGSGVYIDTVATTFRSRLITFSLGASILAGLLLALGMMIARSITRPIGLAVTVAQMVANGDLTSRIEVTSSEEAGQLMQALQQMNHSLIRIVGDVRSGTDTIATASRQIAAGNLDLSSRTEQQASSLEETASSMEELTSKVKQNADHARQANQLAMSASDVAFKGGAVVSQVVDTMASINASSKKIADIIGVIDGISFQTNILALNAAVEAARAGDEGRGFAVVASEVRNLAQRSAAAAKEIKVLIGDSVEKVNAGAKLVDQAGATMDDIVERVKRVTEIMGEITAASAEQTSGIEQINEAIRQIDQVTQQNAALVEEAAAAAESLQDQAGTLAQVVSVFKLDGASAALPPPALAPVTRVDNKLRPPYVAPANLNGSMVAARRSAVAPAAWEEF